MALPDGGPCPIRVATGSPPHSLGTTVNIDRMGEGATAHATRYVIRPRDYGTIIGRTIAAPANWCAWRTTLQRRHLRRVGALAVLLVQRCSDGATEQATCCCANDGASQPIPRSPAADQRAKRSPGDRAGNRA